MNIEREQQQPTQQQQQQQQPMQQQFHPNNPKTLCKYVCNIYINKKTTTTNANAGGVSRRLTSFVSPRLTCAKNREDL